MHNELFSIGPLTVHGYGLMIGLGVIAALCISWRRAKNKGFEQDHVSSLAILALIFGFLGAKILYIFAHWQEFIAAPWQTLGTEGFAVAGGLILGLAAVVFYCRKKKLNPMQWADLLFPGVAIAQGFGRVGCWFAGCCYGTTQIPIQLISAFCALCLGGLLLLSEKKDYWIGKTTSLYVLLYGIGRFVIEFWRADPRGSVAFLSTSQFICIFFIAGGIFLLLKTKPKKETVEEAADGI